MSNDLAARMAALMKSAGIDQRQAILLVKAAADANNIQARMQEKQAKAQLAKGFGKGVDYLRGMFGRTPPVTRAPSPLPAPMRPTPVAPAPVSGTNGAFGFNPKAQQANVKATLAQPPAPRPSRLPQMALGTLGAAGAGTVGVGHASENSQQTVGRSLTNPLTWFNPNTEEDVFKNNMNRWNEQAQPIKDEMAALRGKDDKKWLELNQKLQSGDFGGGMRLGGLNPFASQKAKVYQEGAGKIQSGMQDRYNTEMGKVGPQSGDDEMLRQIDEQLGGGRLLPGQAEALEHQKALLRKRREATPGEESPEALAIKQRMEAAGMRLTPFKTTVRPQAYGSWNTGARPGAGNAQGFAKSKYDMRPQQKPRDPWEAVVNPNMMFG